MFGGGDGVAAGRVHHNDAPARGGVHVHIVDTDTGPSDDFELLRGVDDFLGHLGLAADDQAFVLADDLAELFLLEADIFVGLKSGIALQ